ncbi:MAG: SpaH/EbpB family LPXTG-anchored major pilin [Lactobacillus sp.]|jgi:fimbrial isopeptide formation D2 family protein/LPXTG-motif cell wall-anchored protein|nr:SpaH/EbpB family LPXTG-anchored major pilin [Lactobacillus sp.]
MKDTKLTRVVIAGLMTCTMALSTLPVATIVHAQKTEEAPKAPAKVTIDLHKKQVFDAKEYQNDGTTNNPLHTEPGLNGVKFAKVDITDLFWTIKAQLQEADPDVTNTKVSTYISDNWAELKQTHQITVPTEGPDVVTTQDVDGQAGVARFSDLPGRVDGMNAIYLFEEVSSAAELSLLTAAPLIVGLPVKKPSTNDFLGHIVVYPKNVGIQKELVNGEADNSTDNKVYNFQVGDEVKYTTKVTVPKDIGKQNAAGWVYKYFNLSDKMTPAGTDFVRIDGITATGVSEDILTILKNAAGSGYGDSSQAGWTENYTGFKFDINFATTDQAALQKFVDTLAGKTLNFSYTMKINAEAVPTEDIGNTFYAEFDNGTKVTMDDESEEIETGGYLFTKISSTDVTNGLKGAEFRIHRTVAGTTEYAQLNGTMGTDGLYQPTTITWTPTAADATKLVSGNNGRLQINGLETGQYVLEETKAPNGFLLANKNTPFTILKGTDGKLALTEANLLAQKVKNTPEDGTMPMTGSTGIIAFLIVGTAAMGGAATYYKKRRA